QSNPPGNACLLAAITALTGEREWAIHLLLLPLTLAGLAGTRWLAALLDIRPGWLPPLLVACSGCFLLSATTLMPDATMLGLVVPAVALVWSDERRPHPLKLAAAALLFAVAWSLRFTGLA